SRCCGASSGEHPSRQQDQGPAAACVGQHAFVGVGQVRLWLDDPSQCPVHDHISLSRIVGGVVRETD
ncbi:MAG: hypothetical protein M3Z40_07540, partial [Bifidobacterium sp.]|nr:hypothetical protein [Bifidobacterium sp.]